MVTQSEAIGSFLIAFLLGTLAIMMVRRSQDREPKKVVVVEQPAVYYWPTRAWDLWPDWGYYAVPAGVPWWWGGGDGRGGGYYGEGRHRGYRGRHNGNRGGVAPPPTAPPAAPPAVPPTAPPAAPAPSPVTVSGATSSSGMMTQGSQ